jgi:hypothetical protein
MEFISNHINQQELFSNATDGFRGFTIAIRSIANNLLSQNPASIKVRNTLGTTMKTTLPILLGLYAIMTVLAIAFFPIVLTMLFVAPGVLWGIFTLIPLWSFNISKRANPIDYDRLFVERMRQLDPVLAEEMIELLI